MSPRTLPMLAACLALAAALLGRFNLGKTEWSALA